MSTSVSEPVPPGVTFWVLLVFEPMVSLWFVRCVAPVSPSCLTCPLILYLLMSTCVAAVAFQLSLKLAYSFQPPGFFGIAAAQRF